MQMYVNILTQEIGSAEAWRKRKCLVKDCSQMVKIERTATDWFYVSPDSGVKSIPFSDVRVIPDNVRPKRKKK